MRTWTGKAISPGYAEGDAVIYAGRSSGLVPRYAIDPGALERERDRLRAAIAAARAELAALQTRVSERLGETDAAIFATHAAFLADPSFVSGMEAHVTREAVNAEQAVVREAARVAGSLAALADEHMRGRADDVRDVAHRVLSHLSNRGPADLTRLPDGAIIVARELLPSETVSLDRAHVRGIVTEQGSKTSHAAILAKALGIPAVTGLADALGEIAPGERLLVDGCRGTVTASPGPAALADFVRERESWSRGAETALAAESVDCVTLDGTAVELYANLGRAAEAGDVRAHHLLGVGLFRTEVLFLDSPVPLSLEHQREVYRRVAAGLDGLPLVIRTLDLGGDKRPAFLPALPEHNPIGLRGLRVALREEHLLRTQLAAVLDVAREFPVSVLFPMVVAGDDFARAVDLLERTAAARGGGERPPVGAMIETPASVFALPEIMGRADFLSVGTNDLTQFILAADRDAAELLDDFSILHPAVLRALDMVLRQAASAGRPLTVCGEAAGDPEIAPLLVGLGVRRLSMSPRRSARVRLTLRQCRLEDLGRLARAALGAGSVEEVRGLWEKLKAEKLKAES